MKAHEYDHFAGRPVNKATMDEPQEEFIEPDASHRSPDKEREDEINDSGRDEVKHKRIVGAPGED